MKITQDDRESSTINLKQTVVFLGHLSDELVKASSYIKTAIPSYVTLIAERESLYKVILSLMLDYGVYEYRVNDDAVGNLIAGYELEVGVDDEDQSVNFMVKFPEQYNNETDTA